MASSPGYTINGTRVDSVPVYGCALALHALQSESELHQRYLPLAPTEPPFIALSCAGYSIGVVDARSCPPANSCSLCRLQKRVNAGCAASFILALPADVIFGDSQAVVLATLTALLQVSAELQQPDDRGAPPAQPLPMAYELSIVNGSVLIIVSVPASVPEGSRVVISRVSVAGCDVVQGEAPLEVIVGFNHAPAPEGPVMAAMEAGDVSALTRLLEDGASTEEIGIVVSGRTSVVRF
jgi:hypothetical protein